MLTLSNLCDGRDSQRTVLALASICRLGDRNTHSRTLRLLRGSLLQSQASTTVLDPRWLHPLQVGQY